jgi:hypothetical protein
VDDVAPMLDEGALLVGWRLVGGVAFRARIELRWERPDAAPMVVELAPVTPGRRSFRTIADLALSYRRAASGSGPLDGQSLALLEAFGRVVEKERDRFVTMMADASA